MKKFLAGLISFILVFNSSVMAAVVGTPHLSGSGANNIVCDVNGTTDYYPIGDTRGFSILTKREVVRDCNVTINEQGQCIKWEEQVIDQSMTPGKYNAYESNNYQDSIGSLLAALGAYDQIEHLWSGWKGYCEIGTKSDFSWASDPMFWASMAMSMLMSSTTPGGGATPGSTPGFLDSTSIGTAFNEATTTMGQGLSDAFNSVGLNPFSGQVGQSALNSISSFAREAVTGQLDSVTFDYALKAGVNQVYNNLGRCLVSASWGVATSLYEFGQEDGSGYDCDPVDEVCGTGADAQVSENDVLTMDETQFNDLITQFAGYTPPDNLYDYVYVIGNESGIVTFRMKKMNEMNSTTMDQAAVKELQAKMKEMKLMISLGMTTLSMVGCLGGMGAGVSMPGLTSDDRASIRTLGSTAIDFAGKFIPQPYGPLIGAALKLALYLATSFKSIDSCHDEGDAKEQGVRHTRTQKAIKFDLCHLKDVICAEEAFLFGGCALDGYEYCCYDQIMTKILVEQLKAQLGRDWAHCTGITLRDLNYISFKQCSDSQITDSTTIDGAHQVGIYDTTKAFQYKYKCIDMTEFLEYLQATIGTEISMDDFESFWNDMTQQSPYGATIP